MKWHLKQHASKYAYVQQGNRNTNGHRVVGYRAQFLECRRLMER